MPYYKFNYYRHQLKKMAKDKVDTLSSVTFAPIKLTCPSNKTETPSTWLHLRLPNHLVLEFSEGIHHETLAMLVKALKPC